MTAYQILEFAVSSLTGFVVGYGVGWMSRSAKHRSELAAVTQPRKWDFGKWFSGDRARTILGIVILILAVSSAGLFWEATTAQRRVAACQAQQNEAFADAIKARAQATRDDEDAQRGLAESLHAGVGADRTQRRKAIEDYIAAIDRLQAAQDAHPLVVANCQ